MTIKGKQIKELLGFNDTWIQVAGLPVLGLLIPMAFFQRFPSPDLSVYLQTAFTSMVYSFFYWQVDRLIIAYFRWRYPELGDNKKRLLIQSFWITLFTFSFCNITEGLEYFFGLDLDHTLKPTHLQINVASFTATIAICSVYEAMYAMSKWKQSLIESEKLKKESMQAQLETLKNQVNPHFLFNSLNALTSMIHDQPDKAVEFVQKLSKVYRYILEIKNKEMISLREEMECIYAYQFLLKMRFGDNVRFHIDIPEDHMGCHIVPLSIQILLENAIKHNVISTGKPLSISIQLAKNGNLIVSNNLQKKNVVNGSTKTGISNINSRYQLLTGKQVEVIVTQEQFSVSVPLIHVEEYEAAHH